ncbi:hypothetical protein SPLC1_S500510 [Arthrospira platensis C1]|nr:hypothetical protein SPLC1_S500510 [Arthrospira platensis C1]
MLITKFLDSIEIEGFVTAIADNRGLFYLCWLDAK